MQAKGGTFTAATPTVAVSGLGIGQVQAVIAFATNRTGAQGAGVSTSLHQLSIAVAALNGGATPTTRGVGVMGRNAGTTTGNIDNESQMAAGHVMGNTFGTYHLNGTGFTALADSGFTVAYSAVGLAAAVEYLALSDLDDAEVGDFLLTTGAGNVDVSLTFEPDAVIFLHTGLGTALPYNSRSGAMLGMGVGAADLSQWATYHGSRDGVLPTETIAGCRDDRCIIGSTSAMAGTDFEATYAGALGGGGFRVTKTDPPTASVRVVYLALRGVAASAVVRAFQAAGGSLIDPSPVSGTPEAALVSFGGNLASDTLSTAIDSYPGVGLTDFTRQAYGAARYADAVSTADVTSHLSATSVLQTRPITGGAVQTEVTLASGLNEVDVIYGSVDGAEFGRFGILTLADPDSVAIATQGTVTSVAVLSGVDATVTPIQTTGTVTTVADPTGVDGTFWPLGDAQTRAIITGVSALVDLGGDVATTGTVTSVAEPATLGTLAAQVAVTTVAELTGVSALQSGIIDTQGNVTSVAVLTGVDTLETPVTSSGTVTTTSVLSGVNDVTAPVVTTGTLTSVAVVTGVSAPTVPIATTGTVVTVAVVTGQAGGIADLVEDLLVYLLEVDAEKTLALSAAIAAGDEDAIDLAASELGYIRRAVRECRRALTLRNTLEA